MVSKPLTFTLPEKLCNIFINLYASAFSLQIGSKETLTVKNTICVLTRLDTDKYSIYSDYCRPQESEN